MPSTRRRRCHQLLCAAMLAMAGPAVANDGLVAQGRKIFFMETFKGNGRTCGTCHPADNNYTIDPAYIARLPSNDPLFTADFLDQPTLLRRRGLIVVHADGLGRPGVLRGVPTLLGIGRSLQPDVGAVGDRQDAVGWSGDGVPDGGALRDFAVGAVREHLAKTAARRQGRDFRLPTDHELDALQAFMLTLGHKESDELPLDDEFGVTFRSLLVEVGRTLFNSEVSGPCALCHHNATALNGDGFNGMFDIGVQRRRNVRELPADGGFGSCPATAPRSNAGCGDGRFNAPSLIEAADTTPAFHNNSAATIEDAVRFYTSKTFAASPEGQALPIIRLEDKEIVAIAALLRTLNAIDNIRSSNAMLALALGKSLAAARSALHLASADTVDAIKVLAGGPRQLYADAAALISASLALEQAGARAASQEARDSLLRRAIGLKQRARSLMYDP